MKIQEKQDKRKVNDNEEYLVKKKNKKRVKIGGEIEKEEIKKKIRKKKEEIEEIEEDNERNVSEGSEEVEEEDKNVKKEENKEEEDKEDMVDFGEAMSRIVSSDVKSIYKEDPILSSCIMEISKKIEEKNVENKAKMLISMEKKKEQEKGRIKDIIPLNNDEEVSKILNYEKFLRKTAQKAVINLFNAIGEAQAKAKKVSKDLKKKGLTNTIKREKEVAKMSKQNFFDLIKNPKKI
ncbi:hypothetical protein T552_00976 [Pneumocystis carinii B80]|uniref:Uncharacterized protein n=1 Tax=Pneumocystis carinii (strain B80) TaxID=1408658 RepID=A0A0W4ZN38_PNEC8|nr:hypothetical protein T552_00976 [Pneumocystis carinii B80]KTW29769.1 hypothetical protein T552_00976 [Pneumocystis carinii B80]